MPIVPGNLERIRIGVDLGGTKIEFVALDTDGRELHRHRMATPRFDYEGTVRAVAGDVEGIERELGRNATVGVGIPGTISTNTGNPCGPSLAAGTNCSLNVSFNPTKKGARNGKLNVANNSGATAIATLTGTGQ